MFPKHVLTTTKLVESLYRIVIPVLTTAMSVESLWNFSKPGLTSVLPVEGVEVQQARFDYCKSLLNACSVS